MCERRLRHAAAEARNHEIHLSARTVGQRFTVYRDVRHGRAGSFEHVGHGRYRLEREYVARRAYDPGQSMVAEGERLVFHVVPSGPLRMGKRCLLAQGMAIDPRRLLEELGR